MNVEIIELAAKLSWALSRRRYLHASGIDHSELDKTIEKYVAAIKTLEGRVTSQEVGWMQ